MQYGHFDDEAREYVVETPRTPLPWINYLGTRDFFSLISHTQGGYCFYRDAKLRRLTRFRYNDVPADENGRYLFVNDSGDVWSPSFAPCRVELDRYCCRHGQGYTAVTGARGGLEVTTTTFVPLDDTAELRRVTVTNTSGRPKSVSLFSYVEFCLWDALDDQMNYQRNLSLAEVEIEPGVIYHKTEYRERRNHYAVFWTTAPVAGFDTDRDSFIGAGRSLGQAVVPQSGRANSSVASGWYPIGSHQIDLTLAPGQATTFIIGLGYVENDQDDKWQGDARNGVINKTPAHELMARYATDAQAEAALAAIKAFWEQRLGVFNVKTADPRFDRSVDLWNPYQCMVTFNLSRSASYFEIEPYVYAQMVAGPEAPRFGQAKNSWLTGTAAWAYHAATNWLLGVRPTFDGLVVSPGLPASFGGYEVTRRFRGATYHIIVDAPGRPGHLIVDGAAVAGATLPLAQPGAFVEVRWCGQ